MKKNNIFVILLICVLIAAFAVYNYLYKDHRDIASEDASFSVPVERIMKEFNADQALANAKYADKTIAVTGTVTDRDPLANTVIINEKLSVTFADSVVKSLTERQQIEVKGRFVGYDDLLGELKMDKASIIK